MKAYFINAKHEYIVELNVRDYEHKKELIEANLLELYPYQINGNDIWTDEEAQLKEYSYNFVIDGFVVHGNAIITSVDDVVIPPGGASFISGPAGTFKLNNADSVVAGTNLGGAQRSTEEI